MPGGSERLPILSHVVPFLHSGAGNENDAPVHTRACILVFLHDLISDILRIICRRSVPGKLFYTFSQICVPHMLKMCSEKEAQEVSILYAFPLKPNLGAQQGPRWCPLVPAWCWVVPRAFEVVRK